MPSRAVSPTPSENEVDILGSLLTDNTGASSRKSKKNDTQKELDLDFLDGGDEEEDDGDAAFIALKQAASFRKASNLQGKSVKKGGGFQAMGSYTPVRRHVTYYYITLSNNVTNHRSQCQPTKSHHSKRVLSSYPCPEESYTINYAEEGRCWYGENRFR